jgi:hypothetical protein
MEADDNKDASPDLKQQPESGANKSSEATASEAPWYVKRGSLSGDKRLERLGIDTENLSAVEILIELHRRRVEIEANKKRPRE